MKEQLSGLSQEELVDLVKTVVAGDARMQNSILRNLGALKEKRVGLKSNPWDREMHSWMENE